MNESRNIVSTVLNADIVVIGAGFAGVATTYHLARSPGRKRVLLIEKENLAGVHSSGRNAGMVRQVTSEETISALARAGARYIANQVPPGVFRRSGSLLFAAGPKSAQLERDIARARCGGIAVEALDRSEAVGRFPVLRDAAFEIACHCPTDGVVDLARLVRHYLDGAKAAGAHVLLSATAEEIVVKRGGIHGVRVGNLEARAPVVVNAAGPWASEVAALAGATPVPLGPRRRHIFVTEPQPWVDPAWPFVWDISTEVYVRPEEGGLLLSPCDEVDPGDKDSDEVLPGAEELLRKKLERQFPALRDLPFVRSWSGIRTLTADGRFVIGPDPRLENFFWVAGLGGHGVTTSHAIGQLAAEIVLEPEKDRGNPHSPSRFR
jgi:D-arginine dehydrogenase